MAKVSAGLVMYRVHSGRLQVLLVHPGGPYWQRKDMGAWFIPKGELAVGEDAFAAALREFKEETSIEPEGPFVALGSVKQRSGKIVHAWGFEGDCDTEAIKSNTFALEWPPRSGHMQDFPEIDRAAFFLLEEARAMIYPAELALLLCLKEACADKVK